MMMKVSMMTVPLLLLFVSSFPMAPVYVQSFAVVSISPLQRQRLDTQQQVQRLYSAPPRSSSNNGGGSGGGRSSADGSRHSRDGGGGGGGRRGPNGASSSSSSGGMGGGGAGARSSASSGSPGPGSMGGGMGGGGGGGGSMGGPAPAGGVVGGGSSRNSRRHPSKNRPKMNSAGADFDYSGGNLRYGTGKYTQRENDGFSGGVNLSSNGRSMQHNVYTGGRDIGRRYERAGGGGMDLLYGDDDFMMMEDDFLMMDDDYYDEDMDFYDDMPMRGGGGRFGRGGVVGGGSGSGSGGYYSDYDRRYYDDAMYNSNQGRGGSRIYDRAGRGGPREYSNSRNGGYTTNGRSHQFNSKADERQRYRDDYYYGDDRYYSARYADRGAGYGDFYDDGYFDDGGRGGFPPRFGNGGRGGLLRDML